MQSRFIVSNGLTFHIAESGEGELVLLLHGFPEFWYSWSKVIPLLSSHYKVVAPDLRGYGQSDKPRRVRDYDYKILAADIAGMIRSLGYERATVVGHDWGGAVAWEFARLYPHMVNCLVAINCPPLAVLQKSIFSNPEQFKRSWYVFFFQLPFLPEWRMFRERKSFFWRALRGWAIRKEAFQQEDIEQYEKAFSRRSDFRGPVNYYRAAARAILRGEFQTVPPYAADTLIIWGEADRALGNWLIEGLEPYFTGRFAIRRIPNCSHWVQQEQPEKVVEYILEFMAPTAGGEVGNLLLK